MQKHKQEQQRQFHSTRSQHPTVKFPERGNLAEAQDTDFTTAIMNMFKNLKEDMKYTWMKFMKTLTFKCNNKKNLKYGNQIEQRNRLTDKKSNRWKAWEVNKKAPVDQMK